MAGTKFKSREIFRFSLLLCFVLVVGIVVDADSDTSNLKPSQTPNPNPAEPDDPDLSLVVQRLAQSVEQRNQEYEKVKEEVKILKEQFKSLQESCDAQAKSLNKKLSGVESKISEDHGLWLLTPPVRGPPGKPGVKGEIGLEGPKGKDGANGQPGPKGDRGPSALEAISSCSDAMEILPSPRSKKQTIYPHGNSTSLEVLCDFETDGGGWTIIQKRTSGPYRDFDRNWDDYKNGFGSVSGNFWIGLNNIRALTKNGDQELRIQLEDFQGEKRWAKYSNFSISDASDFYRLSISGFYSNSTAGDSTVGIGGYTGLNGMRFSTKDKDNDILSGDCVGRYPGGWWYSDCGPRSWLNGNYFEKGEPAPINQGILWHTWKGRDYSLAKTEMKIRKRKSE